MISMKYSVLFYFASHPGTLEVLYASEESAKEVMSNFRLAKAEYGGQESRTLTIQVPGKELVLDPTHFSSAAFVDLEYDKEVSIALAVRRGVIERHAQEEFNREVAKKGSSQILVPRRQ